MDASTLTAKLTYTGMEQYLAEDRIYNPAELAALWASHKIGEFQFRAIVHFAHFTIPYLKDDSMTIREAREILDTRFTELGTEITALSHVFSVQQYRHTHMEGLMLPEPGDMLHLFPEALLPYAINTVPETNEEIAAELEMTFPQHLLALRECPREDRHLLAKMMLAQDCIQPIATILSQGIVQEMFMNGIHRQPWYNDMMHEIEKIHIAMFDNNKTRAEVYEQQGKLGLAECMRFHENDDTEQFIQLSSEEAAKLEGLTFDPGFVRIANVYTVAYCPIDDEVITRTSHVIDNYLDQFEKS